MYSEMDDGILNFSKYGNLSPSNTYFPNYIISRQCEKHNVLSAKIDVCPIAVSKQKNGATGKRNPVTPI